jgi:membrane-bound lytic murein transglycosylase B
MQERLLPMLGILTVVLACGCTNTKSPVAVANDVALAQQQATTEVTDARKDAAKEVDSAAAKLDHTSKDLDDAGAKASYEVTIAQADGDHNVAIQKCSAVNGLALKTCKEQADASYEQAKTHANVIRLSKIE